MRELLRALVELGRLDEELAGVVQERESLPAQRARVDEERAAAHGRLDAQRTTLAADEGRQRSLEAELTDVEALRQRLETHQHKVSTNEAYRALLREMETARDSISTHESEILELMDRLDRGGSALRELEGEVGALEERLEAQCQAMDQREAELAAEADRLGRARAERASKLEPSVLARYERIATRRRPAVVVVTAGEVCPACRVGLPPQLVLSMLAAKTLATCGTCHRILVHQRVVEG